MKGRIVWVDNVKVLACILVVLGHFFQSMAKSNLMTSNELYLWFNQTIYFFHVPLFFICSGYVYQKFSVVTTLSTWKNNAIRKIISLGIPFFTFTIVTWAMKTIFAGAVNVKANGLVEMLFITPTSPYWYLYALFFIFLITPTVKKTCILKYILFVAFIFKVVSLMGINLNAYAINTVLENEIWFVIGISINFLNFRYIISRANIKFFSLSIIFLFLLGSIFVFYFSITNLFIKFVLGLCACISIILLIAHLFKDNHQIKILHCFSKYTMPIFLMHTIFAAFLRSVFLHFGITNLYVHLIFGLLISFIGPVLITRFMIYTHFLDFFLTPLKYIKLKRFEDKVS